MDNEMDVLDLDNVDSIRSEYIKELENHLTDSLNNYSELKLNVNKKAKDSKIYRKTCYRYEEALRISEENKLTGVDEVLSCISEMEKVSIESRNTVNKFREYEQFIKQELNKKSDDQDKMNVDVDNFLSQRLEGIISLGEEVMEGMKLNEKMENENKQLDKEFEYLNLRMKILDENEKRLDEFEKKLKDSDNELSGNDVPMEFDNLNEKEFVDNKLADLIIKLDLETRKNAELEYEFDETSRRLEEFNCLMEELQVFKKLEQMDLSELREEDLDGTFLNCIPLKNEFLEFQGCMNRLEEKKLSLKACLAELESSYHEKSEELNKLDVDKKRMIKRISELEAEVESLKDDCGDKAYILDNFVLEKLKKESTMLEECFNITEQIEEDQKHK